MNRAERRRQGVMNERDYQSVPILGEKVQVGTEFKALVRKLNAGGAIDAEVVRMPDGKRHPKIDRSMYLDGEELVQMIVEGVREVVREEVRKALK